MNKIFKTVQYFAVGLIVLIALFMVAPVDTAIDITQQYFNISEKPQKSGGKKLNFLQTYTLESGNNELALNIGLTTDDVEALKNKDILDDLKQSDSIVDSQYTSLNKLAQADALLHDVKYNNTHYAKALKITNYNGVDFYWESQGKSIAWDSYKPGSSSMKSAGCFFFALAAAIGALNDEVCTIEQILTLLGGDIITDEYGTFVVNNNPIPNLNGDSEYIKTILTAKNMYNYEVVTSSNTNFKEPYVYQGVEYGDIETLGDAGKYHDFIDIAGDIDIGQGINDATNNSGKRAVAICYAANRANDLYNPTINGVEYHRSGSSSLLYGDNGTREEGYVPPSYSSNYNDETGNHWFVIIGREGDNYVTLCLSTGEEGRLPVSEFHYLKHVYMIREKK